MSDSQDNVDARRFTRKSFSPSARGGSVTMNGSVVVNIVLAAAALIAVAVAFQADQRSERATDTARLMERETRLMKDDLKFIRAYLSARGIHIPADHDEAEEK